MNVIFICAIEQILAFGERWTVPFSSAGTFQLSP